MSVKEFSHSWGQASVIARLEAVNSTMRGDDLPLVVLSAHLDSVNQVPIPYFLGGIKST